MNRNAKPSRDIAQEVTDKLIAALEAGVSPWRRPWKSLGTGGRGSQYPHNAVTGKAYRGINVTLAMLAQQAAGYASAGWLTYRQAAELGGNVRKGEKGTLVVFWKFLRKTERDETSGETVERKFPMMRHYIVFNVEQCENLPERITAPKGPTVAEEIPDLSAWVQKTLGCKLQHGGDRAFYAPGSDLIQMPMRSTFLTESGFNGTLLHEATHCTGSKSRLDRLKLAPFGSPEYAREELVAEMGASMLCAYLGLDYEVEHHASYLASWLKSLQGDKRFLFTAASQAQKALDYILTEAGLVETQEEAEEAAEETPATPLAAAA